jgi:hypothetical protein
MTNIIQEKRLQQALEAVEALDSVAGKVVRIRVEALV